MGSHRARVLGGLAAVVLVAGLATPAWADEASVRVQVLPGGPEYLDLVTGDSLPVTATVEVYAAAGDGITPITTATGGWGTGFSGDIDLALAPGTYRIRAVVDGWRSGWYRAPVVGASSQYPFIGLYGWRADATFATATDVVVTAGAETVTAPVMLFRSPSSVLGVVSRWNGYGFSFADHWNDKDVFAELVPAGDPTAPSVASALTRRGAFSFEDVAAGAYTIRATIGTKGDTPPSSPDELVDPEVWWYPGTTDPARAGVITVQPGGGHWIAASVATDTDLEDGADGALIAGDAYAGGTVAAVLAAPVEDFPNLTVAEAYQWTLDGAAVDGATGRTFVLPADSAGRPVGVRITGQLPTGGFRFIAVAETPVAAASGTLFSAPAPTIAGTPVAGAVLTAQPGTWTPGVGGGQRSFQWFRDGVAVDGATTNKYTVALTDLGTQLSVAVTGARPGYATATRVSDIVRVQEATLRTVPVPTVRGTAKVGNTLTASAGAVRPAGATVTWQWMRNGVPISGAIAATYVLTAADAGATMTAQLSASLAGYALATSPSAATSAVQPGTITAPRPTIQGTARVGQTLSIDASAWGPQPLVVAYAWQRSGQGGTWTTRGTNPTYVLTSDDRGRKIRLVVTVTREGYTTVERTTAATATVTN